MRDDMDDFIVRLCYLTMLPISQSLVLTPQSNRDDMGISSEDSDKHTFLFLTIKNLHIGGKYGTEDAYIVVRSVKCDFEVELSIVFVRGRTADILNPAS